MIIVLKGNVYFVYLPVFFKRGNYHTIFYVSQGIWLLTDLISIPSMTCIRTKLSSSESLTTFTNQY